MNRDVFLAKMADVLGVGKDDLNEEFELNEDKWDSVAILSAIAVIDEECGVTVPAKELTECTSVGALLELVSRGLEQTSPRI